MKFTNARMTAVICSAVIALGAVTAPTAAPQSTTIVYAADAVSITAVKGWFESASCTWQPVSGAQGYHVYVDGTQIDSMLIRQYDGYFRADALGLQAGSHSIKVVPVLNGSEDAAKAAEQSVEVSAHDRTGFGWVQGTSSGAYNEDGTLRSGAVVLYITEDTKNTVTMDVVTSSKGATTTATGLQNILTAYQKGYDNRPLNIRCIGNITDPETLMDGDLLIKGNGATKRLSCGVTIEGIGNDTVFNGFGLRIANCSNVEVRNIGFMNCNSGEGDDVGLQQNNDHVWVHHCDFFYGDAGSDADQVKGDGALDTKTSSYITHSYNHFWDNGKCNLQGMKSESTENYITYHHNWYDHSDSRHPRIRTCTVHIYNNYFDGNAKYGVGVTMGASAFVEQNYFRNCPNPMMSSGQGTDALGAGTFSGETGGIIKAYQNTMVGVKSYITYAQDSTSFDAYEVTNASDPVPSSVKTLNGGTTYNNFDTSAIMYRYQPDAPADVPSIVMARAGRVDGGDFQWTFDNSVDDASYAVNQALKSALVNYQSQIVAIGSGSYVTPSTTTTTSTSTSTTTTTSSTTALTSTSATSTTVPNVSASRYIHNFTENGLESAFYSISGNLSTGKGTAEYAGLTLTQCLKMESATSIAFTAPADGTLTLVIKDGATFKLDGKAMDIPTTGIWTGTVSAGAHTITKGSGSSNLFYMALETDDTPTTSTTSTSVTTTTTTTSATETTEPVITIGVRGDADEDGFLTIGDAILIARYVAEDETVQLTTQGISNADCDGTPGLTAADTTTILQMLAKII